MDLCGHAARSRREKSALRQSRNRRHVACRIPRFFVTTSTGAAPRSGAAGPIPRWGHRGKSSRQTLRQSDFGAEAEIATRPPRIADRYLHIADPGRNVARRERNIANLRNDPRQLADPRPGAGAHIKHMRLARSSQPHGPTQRTHGIIDINKVANLGPVTMDLDRGAVEYPLAED